MNLFIILFIVNLVRTLFIIVIIYYGIKLISRFVLPLLIDKGVKNMQQKMQDQQKMQQTKRPEGEVTIEKNRADDRNSSQNKGDYVDFEEVD